MNIFSSKARLHLDSHKDLEAAKKLIILDEKKVPKVYIPAIAPNGTDADVLVKAGDRVLVGTKLVVRKDFYVPTYSPVSGTVVGIELYYHPGIGRPAKHLVIENDFKNEALAGALKPIDSVNATKDEITAAIKEAGIVGLGGAGFPTFIKYQNIKGIDYVLINAVECEPYLTTDYLASQIDVSDMLKGAELLRRAAGAKEAVIAFKVHKQAVKQALDANIGQYPFIRYVQVPDVYPMGWEKALIKQVFDREYEKLPAQCGVVVNNAQTAVAVAKALLEGKPMTHRLVSVNGDGVKNPGNILVLIGTPAQTIIEDLGGYAFEDINLLPGGPMTAKAAENDLFAIQPAMGGLTVLKANFVAEVGCLRCGNCTMHCPAYLQPVEIMDAIERKDEERLIKLDTMKCVECGLCSYVCPSKIDVAENVKRAKRYLKFQQARKALKK